MDAAESVVRRNLSRVRTVSANSILAVLAGPGQVASRILEATAYEESEKPGNTVDNCAKHRVS